MQFVFYIKQIPDLKAYLAFKFRFKKKKKMERMKLNVSFGSYTDKEKEIPCCGILQSWVMNV